jgi:O-antigen/teichoic acid export membrane protein
LSRRAPRDYRERRTRGILQGTASGVAWRIVAIAVNLVSIPLSVRYLGSERYGAWITITTVLTFLTITDFGLGASLTNAIGKAQAEEDHETGRRHVSSALVMLCSIAVAILFLAGVFRSAIAGFLFPALQGPIARAEIVAAVWLALSIFALKLPLIIVPRVLAAYHKNALANAWNILAVLGNLVALLAVISFDGGLPWLVLGSFGFGLLVNLASAIWLFGFHKPWLRPKFAAVDVAFVRVLFSDGWKFFIISVGWMINWQTDNLVIAHYLGASQVTPYAITVSIFAFASGIPFLAYPSIWPAYTEAYAQGDYDWIRRTLRSNFKFNFLTSLVICVFLLIFCQAIVRVWAGPAAVPPYSVIVWMAIWRLMFSTLLVGNCLLNATGHLKGMTIYGTITAILNLTLSIFLAKIYGIPGVAAGTTIAYAIASYIPTFVEVRNVIRKFPMTNKFGGDDFPVEGQAPAPATPKPGEDGSPASQTSDLQHAEKLSDTLAANRH